MASVRACVCAATGILNIQSLNELTQEKSTTPLSLHSLSTVAHAAPRAQRQIAKVLAVDHERADVAATGIEIDETRHGVGVRSTPAGQKMRADIGPGRDHEHARAREGLLERE